MRDPIHALTDTMRNIQAMREAQGMAARHPIHALKQPSPSLSVEENPISMFRYFQLRKPLYIQCNFTTPYPNQLNTTRITNYSATILLHLDQK